MGTTPMVASEMYRYLRNQDSGFRDIIMVHTSNPNVVAGTKAATGAIMSKYSDARIHRTELSHDDITTETDLYDFLSVIIETIVRERDTFGVTKFYLNVSGGRKIQSIILSMYAGLLRIGEVYNIIDTGIENFNSSYEMVKDVVQSFYRLNKESEMADLYRKNFSILDNIFFPDPYRLSFFRVPVIEFPEDELNIIKTLIMGTSLEDTEIPDFKVKAYHRSGIIGYDRHRTWATELGKVLLQYL